MKNSLLLLTFPLLVPFYLSESTSTGVLAQNLDKLETDVADLSYKVEEEDLDDFSRLLDALDKSSAKKNNSVKSTGFQKKTTANKGVQKNHNAHDTKKFYKTIGLHDQGAYDDDEVYRVAKGQAGQAVKIDGKEDRSYRNGTKTRGFHRIHHKDEYKKDKVFYEDDETKGSINKVGVKANGAKVGAGVGHHKRKFHHDHTQGVYGKGGFRDQGFSNKELKAYADLEGFDDIFEIESTD